MAQAGILKVETFTGRAILPWLDSLAHLRTTVFRAFPYLYEGSMDYERKYLQTYADSPESVLVLVRDGDAVVGSSTGIPLAHETDEFRRPFRAHGYNVETLFYFAESVLLAPYRGRGLGKRFFEAREQHARALGGFSHATFCAVERPDDHPRRPPDYRPLDRFWERQGFQKHPELRTTFSWQDLDETRESPKPMVFWLKSLEDRR